MSIVKRSLAVGFLVLLVVFSLMILFTDEHHLFILGYHVKDDFDRLKVCWIDSYQSKSGVDVFWDVMWSLPPTFVARTGYTLTKWGITGSLNVSDLGNLEDRLIYTIYTIFSDPVHHLEEPVTDWWPEIDPITGEIIEEETG